ncbi:carboxymuconolactone decarboxylase family protein [Nonomuraea terrae]|uniref:Carboxymuconolactone decarboxylase family protein n=1 Tax=Nonomuraea terrae TaxID=2530383 RepID=A0A4R4XN02_9ACTN|nr:carboxymuconolactone decarboxylase family protein [Nonomuraea terrae]TDD32648.1 carboxymuconolactone decarboxylase family protein [Nonomuraea terrae]
MHARMNHPAAVLPGAMQALHALGRSVEGAGLPKALLDLVHLRASQINGCGVCLDMHARDLKKNGESDERIWTVAGWRDAPYYSDAERAALALTEAVTRLSDRPEAVSDEVWNEAADNFDETELAALLTAIATINVWNRLNAATRQVAGAWNG